MIKKLMMLCVAAMVATGVLAATWADSKTGYTWTYSVKGSGVEIYNYGSAAISPEPTGSIRIPSELGGLPVIGIGSGAFAGMWDLQAVELPQTLKYIAQGAFRDDSYLDNLVIPDSVTNIGDGAFEDCSYLQTLTLGSGLKYVGTRAFAGCTQLQKLAFKEGLHEIADSAFSNCWRMVSVSLPLSTSNIAYSAFSHCSSLVGIKVPTSRVAMSNWFGPVIGQIRDVTIPAGETEVGYGMFSGCINLRTVVFEQDVGESVSNGVQRIGSRAFYGCSSLNVIELPDSVRSIGDEAFLDCKSLTDMALPPNVQELGASAFRGCNNLSSLTLSKSLTGLPDYAFYGCDSLDSFTVPESVTHIGRQFAAGSNRWSGPSAIYYLGNAPSYDEYAYEGVRDELTSYVVLGTRGWDGRVSSRDIPVEWPVGNAYSRDIKTWSPNPFDVTFDANGGVFENDGSSYYACQQISYTAYALPPYNPKRTQCIFDGWWTEPYGGARISSSTPVTLTKAHILYAHWIVGGNVRVRFNANGGVVSPEWKNYDTGVPFGELPVPTREYMDFDGWWTEANGGERITAASEVPAADVELFAHWNPARYKIVFHSENGYDDTRVQSFTYGDTVTLQKNYWSCGSARFAGWGTERGGAAKYADGKTLTEISDIRNGEIHLYAVWIGDSYSVRFDSNGGYGTMPNQEMIVEVSYYLNTNCYARTGWTFKGWSLTPEGSVKYKDGARVYGGLSSTDGATVVLYAVWEGKRTYAVTFNDNGGQCDEKVRYVTEGDEIGTLPVPTRDRYLFQGWYTARTGGVKVTPETKVTRAVTYYAYWVYGVTSYTVTFDPMGGEVAPSNRVVQSGKTVGALPVPTRPKYKFLGWYTAADGGTKISATMKVTSNVTCYARWEKVVFTSLIRFDANGGLCNVTNRVVFSDGRVGALPTAIQFGSHFVGWFTAREGGQKISAKTIVADDVTFYAHWEQDVLEEGRFQHGKLYGSIDSNAEYVDWKEMLSYAYLTKTPTVFIFGWAGCSYCRKVHQAFLDSGAWDLPCLMYYDYYNSTWTSDTKEYRFFSNGDRIPGNITWPSIGIYWNLGNGRVIKKEISLYYSSIYGRLLDLQKNTIDKERITKIIKDILSETNPSTLIDDIGDIISEWKPPSVEEVGVEAEGLKAESDGTVETMLYVHGNDLNILKIEVLGLPTGVKYDSKSMKLYGKIAKPGDYTIKVKVTVNSLNGQKYVIKELTIEVPNLKDDLIILGCDEWGPYIPGVMYTQAAEFLNAEGCTVTGLPPGMKWTSKDIIDSKTKEVITYANSVYGTPTKPGKYTVYVTKTVGKVKHTATASFYVADFPEVYVSTFGSGTGSVTEWVAAAANKKVTLKAIADTKDDSWNSGTVKSVFAGWYEYGGPIVSSVDYRTPSLPYIMGEESYQEVYAKFVTVQEDSNIGLEIYEDFKYAQIAGIPPRFEITSNPGDVSLVARGSNLFVLDIESHSLPKVTVSGLPAGMRFTAKELTVKATKTEDAYDVPANAIYGTPTKPGLYTVTVKLTNVTVKKAIEKKFTIEVPNFTAANGYFADDLDNGVGKKSALTVGVSNIEEFLPRLNLKSTTAKLSVSGLPTGLKYDAKLGKITGIPTKAGSFTVTLTVTEGGLKYVSTITADVQALPDWAVGTFNGGGDNGQVSLTVAKTGKLSGKYLSEGLTWTLAANSFDSIDDWDDAYRATLIGKSGKLAITNEICIAQDGMGGFAESIDYIAYQNNWKLEPWKTVGKSFAKAAALEYEDFASVEGVDAPGVLSLKFAASGAVTVKGSFVTGVNEKTGKEILYSVSGTAVLVPFWEPDESGEFYGDVFVYLPPKAGKFDGYVCCVHVIWTGDGWILE